MTERGKAETMRAEMQNQGEKPVETSAPVKMEPLKIGPEAAKVLDNVWQWHENSAQTPVVLGCRLDK